MKKTISLITSKTNLSDQQAWWLLEFITNKNRVMLMTSNYQLSTPEQEHLEKLINELSIDHKPLAYILGFVPFLDLELFVKPPTLIPRPETEDWVYQVIEMIKKSKVENIKILDIGTGSGCIGLSLAQAFPHAQIYATDICLQALELAKDNAQKNNLTNVVFLESDLLNEIPTDLRFDLILSNPPYINPTAKLEASVSKWEDHGALFAKNKGLSIIEQICEQAPKYLKKNNELEFQLVIEIDMTQGQIIKNLLENNIFKKVAIKKDQFDRDRTIWAR